MKFFKYYCFAALFALLLGYLQVVVLSGIRNCVLRSEGLEASLSSLAECASASDLILLALFAFFSIILVLFGFRRFANLYEYLEKRGREWVLVAVVTVLASLPYLSPGNVFLGDAIHFSGMVIYMKQSLLSLHYPLWQFYWHMGSGIFTVHGWLYFLVSGMVNIFLGIDWTNKIMFFALHLGSALLAYAFVKTATKNSKMAIIAALVYALSFEHMARVMIGRTPIALTYLLTPLLFLIYEMRLDRKLSINKSVALTAVAVALLIFNHPADAMFITAIFVLYAALKTFEAYKKAPVEIITSLFLALLLVSFWVVPIIAERDEASGTSKAIDVFVLHMPDIEVAKDMVLWPGKWGLKQVYYLGLSTIALSFLGLFYLLKIRKLAAATAAIASLLLLLMQSTRYAPVMLLMLGLSAGYGFVYLCRKVKLDSRKLLFVIAIIMVVDMVPATVQLGYPDFSYSMAFYREIKADDGQRILDLSTDRKALWPLMPYMADGDEAVFGPVMEGAPRSFAYGAAISNRAAQEFYDFQQNFSQQTLQGLYLLGVRYVVVHQEQIGKNPKDVFGEKRSTLGIERGLQAIELESSPIIVSSRKTEVPYTPLLDKLEGWDLRQVFEARGINLSEVGQILDLMQLNIKTGVAGQILVKDSNSEYLGSNFLEINVRDVKTSPYKVEIEYEVSDDAFMQLSYAYSSHLSVKMDGEETGYWKTAINTIAVKTSAGNHKITIQGRQSNLRKQLMLVSLAGLLAVACLAVKRNRGFFSFRQ